MNVRSTCLLAVALLALASPPAAAVFWTEADPPVPGKPTRVVFTSFSYGGQPTLEVQVEGDRILLMQRNMCAEEICFSAAIPAVVEGTLPPLQPGSYTVMLDWELNSGEPTERATLVVADAPAAARVLPAEGFWSPVGMPGSGLFLERRGELLALSAYTYDKNDGTPQWANGVGSYSGDSVPMQLQGFRDGDCLGCAEHRPPQGGPIARAVQLRFESARRAWLDVAGFDGPPTTVPVVSLPYGAAYLPYTLPDSVDAEFGSLALPDLRGRWLLAIEGADAPDALLDMDLQELAVEGGVVLFRESGPGRLSLSCSPATDTRRAGCTHDGGGIALDPPPTEPAATFLQGGVFFPLGDIEPDRMRGIIEADGQTWRVRGVRVADVPAGDPHAGRAAEG